MATSPIDGMRDAQTLDAVLRNLADLNNELPTTKFNDEQTAKIKEAFANAVNIATKTSDRDAIEIFTNAQSDLENADTSQKILTIVDTAFKSSVVQSGLHRQLNPSSETVAAAAAAPVLLARVEELAAPEEPEPTLINGNNSLGPQLDAAQKANTNKNILIEGGMWGSIGARGIEKLTLRNTTQFQNLFLNNAIRELTLDNVAPKIFLSVIQNISDKTKKIYIKNCNEEQTESALTAIKILLDQVKYNRPEFVFENCVFTRDQSNELNRLIDRKLPVSTLSGTAPKPPPPRIRPAPVETYDDATQVRILQGETLELLIPLLAAEKANGKNANLVIGGCFLQNVTGIENWGIEQLTLQNCSASDQPTQAALHELLSTNLITKLTLINPDASLLKQIGTIQGSKLQEIVIKNNALYHSAEVTEAVTQLRKTNRRLTINIVEGKLGEADIVKLRRIANLDARSNKQTISATLQQTDSDNHTEKKSWWRSVISFPAAAFNWILRIFGRR